MGVILTLKQYHEILDELEELECIKAFDKAILKKEATIPLREAIKLRRKKNVKI